MRQLSSWGDHYISVSLLVKNCIRDIITDGTLRVAYTSQLGKLMLPQE